jgi:hypothetical protein
LHQVGFADVFVRASVPRIEHQRLLIMSHRRIDLPQTAIGVTKIVLNIGIAGVAEPGRRECIDGAIPVAGDNRSLTGCETRIERRPIRSLHHRSHSRADRPRFDRDGRLGYAPARTAAGFCRAGGVKRYTAGTAANMPATAVIRIERIMIVEPLGLAAGYVCPAAILFVSVRGHRCIE